ncbi:hypothetical protein C8R45DRAFT_944344 [Mycena sanguinolenta]|nr:hypothetical protein C8R45DRAFT_944344 [Mycena sanguinolenta]
MYLLLFLLAATFGCALAAPDSATAQPALALPGLWIITDFQGTIFNLVDTQEANATPVQADSGIPGQWIFVNTTGNEFEIINVGGGVLPLVQHAGHRSRSHSRAGRRESNFDHLAVQAAEGNFTLEPTNPSDPAQIFSIRPSPLSSDQTRIHSASKSVRWTAGDAGVSEKREVHPSAQSQAV